MKTKTVITYSVGKRVTKHVHPSFGSVSRPLTKLPPHAIAASRSACTESLLSTLPSNQQISISGQEIDRDLGAGGFEKWTCDRTIAGSEDLEWQTCAGGGNE